MFRERLTQVIQAGSNMAVCGEAESVEQALQVIEDCRPDIVIADITLRRSDGLGMIKDLKARGLHMPVLVLSMHDESLYAERALRAGARGYLTKNAVANEVVEAISKILDGGMYFSEDLTAKWILESIGGVAAPSASGPGALSDRELEIFRLVGLGRAQKEIAAELRLADSTVETYCGHIREKLGIKTAAELYASAAQWRIRQGL